MILSLGAFDGFYGKKEKIELKLELSTSVKRIEVWLKHKDGHSIPMTTGASAAGLVSLEADPQKSTSTLGDYQITRIRLSNGPGLETQYEARIGDPYFAGSSLPVRGFTLVP